VAVAAAQSAAGAKAAASTAIRAARRSLTPHAQAAAAAREAREELQQQVNPHNIVIKSFADVAVADLELVSEKGGMWGGGWVGVGGSATAE